MNENILVSDLSCYLTSAGLQTLKKMLFSRSLSDPFFPFKSCCSNQAVFRIDLS